MALDDRLGVVPSTLALLLPFGFRFRVCERKTPNLKLKWQKRARTPSTLYGLCFVERFSHIPGNSTKTFQQSAIPLIACSLGIEQNIWSLFLILHFARFFGQTHLDCFLFHRHRSANVVQFVVQAAGIAHRITILIATPQRCRVGLAVRAQQIVTPRCTLHREENALKMSSIWLAQKNISHKFYAQRGLIIFRFRRGRAKQKWKKCHLPDVCWIFLRFAVSLWFG